MNKNIPILSLEYNTETNVIDTIYDINHIEYAPLAVLNATKDKSKSILKETNKWFRGRGIPSWRKDLERLLEKLDVSLPEELLNKSYVLSLSDQYWLKEETSNIQWKDINFFSNDFEYKAYLEAALDSSSHSNRSTSKALLHSPNNTTDGMLQKGWIIENGKRILVKGTYTFNREEPFNEWLASQICKRLDFDYCDYQVEWNEKTRLVSKCENFITEYEEIISAYDILQTEKKTNNINDYEFYIQILEKHHVPHARKNVANMFVVDYLMKNIDRHLKNFGIIRNVNSLEWVRTTPIFDTGESMECDKYFNEFNFSSGKGKFFYNASKDYDEILKTILNDIQNINIEKLEGLVYEYQNMLMHYSDKLDISNRRIEGLTYGLELRIEKLKKYIQSNH